MKEKFLPVDLGHLEEKCLAIVDCFDKANDPDRSKEYREHHLKKAEQVADTLRNDFRYYFDKYEVSGVIPYGLSTED